jgi:hypothetical protein
MRRDVFQAIADPTRREILGLIAQNPMTPNAVAESFDVSRQAISKHMKILTECGLLSYSIEGREYYYTVQTSKLKEVNDWLKPFKKHWEKKFDQLDEILANLKPKKHGRKK